MTDNLGPNATLEEIEEEIEFISVLIQSLDPHADDYQERLSDLERSKASAVEMLQARLHPAHTGSNQQPAGPEVMDSSDSSPDPAYGFDVDRPGFLASPTEGFEDPFKLPSQTSNHSDSYGMNQASSTNGASTNKRPRTSMSYPDPHESSSKRSTPRSSDVNTFEYSDYLEKARLKQMAAEARLQKQNEIRRRDAALAQQWHQQNQAPSFASSSRSNSGGIQTTLNYNGEYQRLPPRPTPPSLPERPAPHSAPSAHNSFTRQSPNYQTLPPSQLSTAQVPVIKNEAGARGQMPPSQPSRLHAPPIKNEGGSRQNLPLSRPQSSANAPPMTIDLTGDSDEEDMAFEPTSRQPVRPDAGFQANSRQASQPLGFASYAGMPSPFQMPGAFPAAYDMTLRHPNDQPGPSTAGLANFTMRHPNQQPSRAGFSFTSAASQLANSLRGPIHELGNLIAPGAFGSSTHPWDLEDDDDDDLIFTEARRINDIGSYRGNEDLYRTRYDILEAYNPTQSREEIKQLLQNIRPDEEMPAHLRVQTPDDMTIRLHKYQELGLTWLQNCEKGTNKGGILADDMGLGKTIQMLSLIVTHKSEDFRCKTTLIVAPVALMRQWKQEIAQKIKPGRYALTVTTHHGPTRAKDFKDLQKFDVVLTTFGSLAAEVKKLEKFHLRKKQDPSARPLPSEKCVLLGDDARWYRVILDEAQCIKNRSTQTSKAACLLKATYRFCMTGTPMMNNVEELYSLIKFLNIKPYCHWEKFRLDVAQPLRAARGEGKSQAMQRLQTLCKAIMIRRTKKSTFEGKPILVLPDRSTDVENPEFNEDEKAFYDALEKQTQLQFNRYLKRGTVGKNYSAVLVLLLRLRQACCHPHLIKDFGVSAAADLTADQMIDFARKLDPAVVNRIKESNGEFECPVCYDVTPNPAIFIPCGHDACSECFVKITDPANAIQSGDESGKVRCPNCRGPIDAKQLTDFASFKRVHMPELLTDADRMAMKAEDDSDVDSSDSDVSSDDEDDDDDDSKSLNGFIVRDDEIEDEDQDDDDEDEDDLNRPVKSEWQGAEAESAAGPSTTSQSLLDVKREASDSKKEAKSKKAKGKQPAKGKGKQKAKKKTKSKVTLAELKKLASRNIKARKAYLRRLRKDWVSSAKIDRTMDLLNTIMSAPEKEKILIFSQWTSLLDLLEIPIDDAGFGYRRYDGSMSARMRDEAVDDFRDPHKNVRIMLISLKAGNAGLNLNMASQVIILDPFWNPYIEEQAIDRAHRIGQVRPVKIHRVLIKDTVEDRIIELQEKKRALINQALDEKEAAGLARLGVRELAYLFGVPAN